MVCSILHMTLDLDKEKYSPVVYIHKDDIILA